MSVVPMLEGMDVDLFATIGVRDYPGAIAWYTKLFGCQPTYVVSETEAMWELAPHRFLVVDQRPEQAGCAFPTLFIGDLGTVVTSISSRGLDPAKIETYDNGVRKIIYRDPEGNEIGLGGTS